MDKQITRRDALKRMAKGAVITGMFPIINTMPLFANDSSMIETGEGLYINYFSYNSYSNYYNYVNYSNYSSYCSLYLPYPSR